MFDDADGPFMPFREVAPPGRSEPMPVPPTHHVLQSPMSPPYPDGTELAMFGMGCFWGAEKLYWETPGVVSTAVGYAAGVTRNPIYAEVCSGLTGHAEVVRVVYDPGMVTFGELLRVFWEGHDPTQGMRQGIDVGTQYRSGIYWYSERQRMAAESSLVSYQAALDAAGRSAITTEVREAPQFYYAEAYHQQYVAKHPGGYCGVEGTGVGCPKIGE